MSSINTVSGNGNKNYVSGLASGMDTESIVKSLLMGTQTKIDKQSGLKQQLEWKQDIYRDLITKINTFSDKYFSYYGPVDPIQRYGKRVFSLCQCIKIRLLSLWLTGHVA